LSVKANSLWFLAGNVAYTLAQWGMVVLVARLGTVQSVGIFALAFAVCAPVVMLANLRLRFVQASDVRHENAFAEYLALRMVTTIMALAAIVVIATWSYGSTETALTIVLVGIAKSFEAMSDVYYGFLQKHQRMDILAASLMIKSVLSLVLFGGGLYFTGDIVVACAGLAIGWGLVFVIMDSMAPVRLGRTDSIAATSAWQTITSAVACLRGGAAVRRIARLAYAAAPLGLVAFLVSLSANIPRYVIEWKFGSEMLGYYAAMSYFMVAAVTLMSSVGQAAMPRLAQLFSASESGPFKAMLTRLTVVALAAGVMAVAIAMIMGGPLLRIFYGPAYVQHQNVFNVLMVATALNFVAMNLWYAITAMREFRIQLPLFAVDVLIVAAVSMATVPRIGIMGGAVALVAVMTYHVVTCSTLVRRRIAAIGTRSKDPVRTA
jgi:O-antigen/teichoic acid export membrane protein